MNFLTGNRNRWYWRSRPDRGGGGLTPSPLVRFLKAGGMPDEQTAPTFLTDEQLAAVEGGTHLTLGAALLAIASVLADNDFLVFASAGASTKLIAINSC